MADSLHALVTLAEGSLAAGQGSASGTITSKFSSEWSAKEPQHRRLIRRDIAATLPGLAPKDQVQLEDLAKPPRLSGWSVSISHCETGGGWLAVKRPLRIGFDVEEVARLKKAVLERISRPEERVNLKNIFCLWPAKEACFKALENDQPEALTQIILRSIDQVPMPAQPHLERFSCLSHPDAHIWVLSSDSLIYSCCLITPSVR